MQELLWIFVAAATYFLLKAVYTNIMYLKKICEQSPLTRAEYEEIIGLSGDPEFAGELRQKARETALAVFGLRIYIRGLIEISSCCKNDCLYCGLRRSNRNAQRYRLSAEEIWECCVHGQALGFRTFVLQGGEDPGLKDEEVCRIVEGIKKRCPDCAVTLSLGEKSRKVYQAWFDAGADRYLLRHETADADHYSRLHPPELTLENRKKCLYDLKEIGYQVGTGFMVGSPGQTPETLAKDLEFIEDLQPHMIGIGPFVPHKDTCFAAEPAGSPDLTTFLIAFLRLRLPEALIPATTALGTVLENGREQGILAGANVLMPNLSPADILNKYSLYDNKLNTGLESAEGLEALKERMGAIGYEIAVDRGDSPRIR